MKDDELNRAAQGVIDAAPAVMKALHGAMDRLSAPFYVRAWHQLRKDEGWGDGSELHICLIVVGSVVALGLISLL